MAEFIENHKAFLTPLSPIHIGCGEDFEPTDYVIRENVLYGFDPASVPLTSRERGELASCALKRTLQGWARFFKRHEASFYAFASTAVPVCGRVARNYKRMIETTDQRNDNVIQLRLREDDGRRSRLLPGIQPERSLPHSAPR